MSDTKTDTDTDAAVKKKGGFMKKALIGLVLMGMGVGGTYGAFAMGVIGDAGHDKEEEDKPKLVLKGEEDPYPFAGESADKKVEMVHGTGGSKYRTAYYNFTDEFTSNLAGGSALVQVAIAASTQHDGRVIMWLEEHETALRSRVLAELASTDEASLVGVNGKEELQDRLTKAMNEVLEEREGFGGIDKVYFRSFIVQ